MANTWKSKTNAQIVAWTDKQIEHAHALLILAKKDESYIVEHLQFCNKFYKEWNAIRKTIKL
jgi:hypothetical protein